MKRSFIMYLWAFALVIAGIFFGLFYQKKESPPEQANPVIIVGAGAAGLTAAHRLEKAGIDYLIIEASDTYGGRMREVEGFADLPLDIGAEWIHEDPSVLELIADNPNVLEQVEVITYNPREFLWLEDGILTDESQEPLFYKEYKFSNTTWLDFFETYIVPTVEDSIVFNRAVSVVDYSGDQIIVSTVDGKDFSATEKYIADQIIMTVPVSAYHNDYIDFSPPLLQKQTEALKRINFQPGLKAFFEFSEPFYPEMFGVGPIAKNRPLDQHLFYDALFKKESDRNIMGALIVGNPALDYVNKSEKEIVEIILGHLDQAFDGAATRTYSQSIIQNWSNEPYIQGTYTTDTDGWYRQTIRAASQPIANRVFFAGAALTTQKQGTVPGAARTGVKAAEEIIEIYQ